MRNKKITTTKRVVWFCLLNGVGWVWCSYVLAYLGRYAIAETLSKTAITEIIGVVLVYCLKSLLEKREGFGAVGGKNGKITDDCESRSEKTRDGQENYDEI